MIPPEIPRFSWVDKSPTHKFCYYYGMLVGEVYWQKNVEGEDGPEWDAAILMEPEDGWGGDGGLINIAFTEQKAKRVIEKEIDRLVKVFMKRNT